MKRDLRPGRFLVWSLATLLWANAGSAAQVWSGFQGDAAHDGYVPGNFNPAHFSAARQVSFNVPEAQQLTPAVAGNGAVFLVQSSYEYTPSFLFAYNSHTGSSLWTASIGTKNQTGNYLYGVSPAGYGDGNVYVETENNTSSGPASLIDFNGANGQIIFSSPLSAQYDAVGGPTIFNGNVYGQNGYFGGLSAFNSTTGAQSWYTSVPQQSGWSVAADSHDLYLYMGDGSGSPGPSPGRLYAINRATGSIDYQILDPRSNSSDALMNPTLGPNSDAFVISGYPYFTNGSRLIGFDLANHVISWQRQATTTNGYTGDIALANGRLYTEDSGILTVLDENSGSQLWTWTPGAGQSLFGNLIVTDSAVFVSSGSGIYAIDLQTHLPVWSTSFSGTLSMADNMLFAVGQNSLHAYSLGTPVPEPPTMQLAIAVAIFLLPALRRLKRCSQTPI